MKLFLLHCGLLGLALSMVSCTKPEAPALRISAASSLADALQEINASYSKETGVKVSLNLAASSLLQRQIEEGVPCDVFISADSAQMDTLDQKGFLLEATREDQLSNTLVIVVPRESNLVLASEQDLQRAEVKKIATGNPASVPVGGYAKTHLEKLGVWRSVEPKVLSCENVRAALAAVESGNVEVGIVYKTDAAISKKVKIAYEIPADSGPKIVYPIAALRGSAQPALAQQYLDFLDAPASREIFEKYGFKVLREAEGLH